MQTLQLLVIVVALSTGAGSHSTEAAGADESTFELTAEIRAGERFSTCFGEHYEFLLEPIPHGWVIEIHDNQSPENLSRLTPPFHFVPNPRYLEGWHFRNVRNNGPNEGSVNAPQEVRRFIFSPEVAWLGSEWPVDSETIEAIELFGRGELTVLDYVLDPPAEGGKASFEFMRFRVCLKWAN